MNDIFSFYNNNVILNSKILQEDERIIMGGSSQTVCYLYDSKSQKYDELQDFDMAKVAPREYFVCGRRTSYREIFAVYTGVKIVSLHFLSNIAMRNKDGYWMRLRYNVELQLRATNPLAVIQKNIRDVNSYVAGREKEIRKLVVHNNCGKQLRAELNKRFVTDGLSAVYVDVRPDETYEGLVAEQRKENERLACEIDEKFKVKIDDIQASGKRLQAEKNVDTEIVNAKKKLALKFTEKQVVLNMVESMLNQLHLPGRERIRGLVLMAGILGIDLPEKFIQLSQPRKGKGKKMYVENLP